MTAKQKKLYLEMKRDLITFIDSQEGSKAVIANVAIVKALRLMQIASGFAGTDDGDIIEIPDNPKIKAVKELLETLVDEHKIILWCAFRNNYEQLGRLCTSMGIDHVFLTGDQSLKEKQEAMERFNTLPECRIIIANRRAGGIGINLVAADYSIVVSRNFALSDELQSEARNYRGGSQIHERITKIDLVMKDTIEEDVQQALANKKDLADSILEVIRR
jgi:SNF2 family DNA or RNA helicase